MHFMKIKPWQKIGHPHILLRKNSRSFINQKFINPRNGSIEEFLFFSGKLNAVVIFPITKDKKIVAIRQFRHAADKVFVELPGGAKRSNETWPRAAKRELLEETGFYPQKIVRFKTKKNWFDPGSFKNFYIPCLATGCYQVSEPKLDATECIETIKVPINEWLDMIYDGLITDAKTLAVTFLALPYIGINLKK